MAQTTCLASFGPVFCPYPLPTLLALSLIASGSCCLFVLAIVVVVVIVVIIKVSEEVVVVVTVVGYRCPSSVSKSFKDQSNAQDPSLARKSR